jgi:hypothetical protein
MRSQQSLGIVRSVTTMVLVHWFGCRLLDLAFDSSAAFADVVAKRCLPI